MTGTILPNKSAAKTIAERLSDLVGAYVYVLDGLGLEIAGSAPEGLALPRDMAYNEPGTYTLRIPVDLSGDKGEVLIVSPAETGAMPPRVAQSLVELVAHQFAMTTQLHDRYELKNKFIHDLLHGLVTNEVDLLREGQILGMDFTRPRAVVLIQSEYLSSVNTPGRELMVLRRAQLIINIVVRFFKLPNDAICAYVGGDQIAVLKASGTQDLEAWADEDGSTPGASWANLSALKKASGELLAQLQEDTRGAVSIGIGRYHPGILGICASYRDASAALELGGRIRGWDHVHCLDEVGSAAFVGVSDEATKLDLAHHLLSPLDREPELLETLRVFLREDCNPATAAKALAVHRNTLLYRLNKVRLLTGLDPHRFQDAARMYLALVLRDLG